MIVQSAFQDQPHFIITMAEHSLLAGKFARVFGNTRFEPVAPLSEMLYLIDHHDQGWFDLDVAPKVNPKTGLPWHLSNTPSRLKVTTMMKSVHFNQLHHCYCGLLAAMHMWGIYHGRYGLSDNALIDTIPKKHRGEFNQQFTLLAQKKAWLEIQLAQDPTTENWLRRYLWQNYKQLQFFDSLALYFNCTDETKRLPASFVQVPLSAIQTQTIKIEPIKNNQYKLTPFPFKQPKVSISFQGRYLFPAQRDTKQLHQALLNAPLERQEVQLVGEVM